MRLLLGAVALAGLSLLAACGDGADPAVASPTGVGGEAPPPGAGATAPAPSPIATTAPPSSPPPRATSTTSTVTSTTLPPIILGFAGDTSFTHGLHARDPLGDVIAELAAPDVMIVNLETTVAEADVGRAIQKRFTFKSPPVTAELLAAAGVDVAALANNHALDYGPDAVLRTIEILEAAGVIATGTGTTSAEAYAGQRLGVSGWDVAILSFSRVPCDSPEPGETYIEEVAWACPQFEELTIGAVAAAADADFTVVMVHWGIQRETCPAAHQRNLATKWIAAGADVVVGSHPHVLQGVERIDGAWVIHSTGNFAFPSARNESSYSAIFTLEVTAGGERLHAVPVRIQEGRPVIAEASRPGILEDLTQRSFGYVFGPSGEAIATTESGRC